MPSESGEARRATTRPAHGQPVPEQQEQLPCPRCDSTNTKFCYYNNYNFSQPRHFCKSCRRYWTQGGTLRDIPIGGGSRKSAKRSRTTSTSSSAVAVPARNNNIPLPATPVLLSPGFGELKGGGGGGGLALCGSFTSLLNSNVAGAAGVNGPGGFLGLGGFGLGFGPGLEEVGFGLGRAAVWPFSMVGEDAACVGSNGGPAAPIPATWQQPEGLENSTGFAAAAVGDCFAWPELAISTPGNTLK